jgi:hypothetical protein
MADHDSQGGAVMRVAAVIEVIRSALVTTDEAMTPDEQDQVYSALLAHIRARRPETVSPLGTLPPPTEPIRDPRGGRS